MKNPNLVQRVETVQSTSNIYGKGHPNLFFGFVRMEKGFKIRLLEKAVPYAVSAPRRVSFPVQATVKAKLQSLEDMDLICPVTMPTDWCTPIVVVPKAKDTIQLCLDLTKLNESERRGNYAIPSDHASELLKKDIQWTCGTRRNACLSISRSS